MSGKWLDSEKRPIFTRGSGPPGRGSTRPSSPPGAKVVGISESHLRAMEKGSRRPSLSVAEDLIDTFGIDWELAVELRAKAAIGAGRDFRLA